MAFQIETEQLDCQWRAPKGTRVTVARGLLAGMRIGRSHRSRHKGKRCTWIRVFQPPKDVYPRSALWAQFGLHFEQIH